MGTTEVGLIISVQSVIFEIMKKINPSFVQGLTKS